MQPGLLGVITRFGSALAVNLWVCTPAQAQQWFDLPPRADHPGAVIRIAGVPDSRQPSGLSKGKMEMRYAAPKQMQGPDKQRKTYNRTVTDVVFDCNRSQVGFLATTTLYLDDAQVALFGNGNQDASQMQFVRFPEGSPQMKALQAACTRP